MTFQTTQAVYDPSTNQSINIFNVLGDKWDPTADKKFSSVNSIKINVPHEVNV